MIAFYLNVYRLYYYVAYMMYVWTIQFKTIKIYSELEGFTLGLDDFLDIFISTYRAALNKLRYKRPWELDQNKMYEISFLQ